MVYELITAKGSNKENGAVNYALAHLEFGAVPLTSITTRVFLGQQIQCTQCHDHPSNDWKQADFWGINAFFKGLKREAIRTTDASGAEVIDHMELTDEPTDAYRQLRQAERPGGDRLSEVSSTAARSARARTSTAASSWASSSPTPRTTTWPRRSSTGCGATSWAAACPPGRRLRAAQPAEPSRAARRAGRGVHETRTTTSSR